MDGLALLARIQRLLTPEGVMAVLAVLGRLALILAAAYVAGALLQRAVTGTLNRLEGRTSFFTAERTAALRKILHALVRCGVLSLAFLAVLGTFGVNIRALLEDTAVRGYLYAALVVVAAHLAVRVGGLVIDELFERAQQDVRFLDAQRAVTLRGLVKSVLRYAVDIGAALMVLAQLGFNINALLASVGIASLAVGFGAQNLVRDVISGFFILFENQFQVGDHVEMAGVAGIVEEMGFRVTKVRDFDGSLHVIPNGEITIVRNLSQGPMRVLFEVPVAYEEDVEHAMRVIQAACDPFSADPRVVEGPSVLGVGSLAASSVNIQVWARAQPGEQWAVERDLRLAVKKALEQAGIEIPYPRQVLVPASATRIGGRSTEEPPRRDAGRQQEPGR